MPLHSSYTVLQTRTSNREIVSIGVLNSRFFSSNLSSSGDLQPSIAIANQLPGQLVYTQITTRGPNCFKFIMALIMPSRNII